MISREDKQLGQSGWVGGVIKTLLAVSVFKILTSLILLAACLIRLIASVTYYIRGESHEADMSMLLAIGFYLVFRWTNHETL